VGETPNLAARLQTLAEPGSVVVAASTYKLIGGIFEYEELGNVELKGLAAPVAAWRVRREGAIESRFEALHSAAALTPLVGREEEIELLLRRWTQAKEGEGRVVLLTGEPGIGKSRLSVAFQDRLRDEPYVRLHYSSSPHHQDSALHPTIVQLERAAGFERKDMPDIKFQKLRALLTPTSSPIADVTHLAELLHIPAGDLYAKSQLNPQRKKEETFEALLRQLVALTQHEPALMIYEDVHWIDPSSRELLDRVVDRVATLPMLLLITFRPEFQPPWSGLSHVTMLALNRLSRRQGAMLVQQVAGNKPLPADTVQEIVTRTDGVPLFVEELTKVVLEADAGKGKAETRPPGPPYQRSPCPRRLTHPSWRGSIDSGRRRSRWRRRALPSAVNFRTSCSAPSPAETSGSYWTIWLDSSLLNWCSNAGRHQSPFTPSSMLWCRTLPTTRSCAAIGSNCTRASPKSWSGVFPSGLRMSRNSWRTISRKLD
jgi:hypothetical protein